MKSGTNESGGLRYAAAFDEKILGVACGVDVAVDLVSGEASVVVSMKRMLSPEPAFQISREELVALLSCIKTAKARSGILDHQMAGAKFHQLRYASGGATLDVVQPAGKSAWYTLNVGLFQREGELEDLSTKEIDEAVAKLNAMMARVASNAKK